MNFVGFLLICVMGFFIVRDLWRTIVRANADTTDLLQNPTPYKIGGALVGLLFLVMLTILLARDAEGGTILAAMVLYLAIVAVLVRLFPKSP